MSVRAYYNEHDPMAAAWLRELISAGLIAPGEVDERSISDVHPDDLLGFTQCHFFAGISGWSAALRQAGWPDEIPVWTGSCPCQPFSGAGKRLGTADPRHLWPEFLRLIAECAPTVCFGEQVASKDGRLWLAGVRADLEAVGYAFGALDSCAAGIGAPHPRQRLYWLGISDRAGRQQGQSAAATAGLRRSAQPAGGADRLEHAKGDGWEQRWTESSGRGTVGGCGWSDYDIAHCRTGKLRRVERGTFPMAARFPRGMVPSGDPSASEVQATGEARVMRLRGYGNAICVPLAAEFIRAAMEAISSESSRLPGESRKRREVLITD